MPKELTKLKNLIREKLSASELMIYLQINSQELFTLMATYLYYEYYHHLQNFPYDDLDYLFDIVNNYLNELNMNACFKSVRKFKKKVEAQMMKESTRYLFRRLGRLNEQLSLLERSMKALESERESFSFLFYLTFHKRDYNMLKCILTKNDLLANVKDHDRKPLLFHVIDRYVDGLSSILEYDGLNLEVVYLHSVLVLLLKQEQLQLSADEIWDYLTHLQEKIPIHVYREVLSNFRKMLEQKKYEMLHITYQGGLEEYLKTIPIHDGRYDFTHLYTLTLDSESAYYLDDAFSISKLENGNYVLLVHVTDVINQYLLTQDMTHVLNEHFTIGPEFLKKKCSLIQGQEKEVVTHAYELDLEGNIVCARVLLGTICPDVNMRFFHIPQVLKADLALFDEPMDSIELLAALAEQLTIRQYGPNSFNKNHLGNRIVERMMVLTNNFIARIFELADYPFLYKVQQGIDLICFTQYEPMSEKKQSALLRDMKLLTREMTKINPPEYTMQNIGYYKRGLAVYGHVTSPMIETESKITQALERSYIIDGDESEERKEAWEHFLKNYIQQRAANKKVLKKTCQESESML